MKGALRWLGPGLVALACAVIGVVVASMVFPHPQQAATEAPVVVAVTTTATAHPSAQPAPVSSPLGINLAAHSVDDPASMWVVVNKRRPLDPQDYVPRGLVTLTVPGGGQMTKLAAAALKDMYDAAKADGAPFRASTAYRSYNFQKGLFAQYVAQSGVAKAETFSARAGYSEHQTGLTVDVYDPTGCHLQECYAKTASGAWLAKHAAEFGFIERYPKGYAEITGYKWEPWHWRYVGVELAEFMRDQHIATLEEALGLPAAPDYD